MGPGTMDIYFKNQVMKCVLEHETPCYHEATFKNKDSYNIMAVPVVIGSISPPQNGKTLECKIICPVCDRVYEKASKEFLDAFLDEFMKRQKEFKEEVDNDSVET